MGIHVENELHSTPDESAYVNALQRPIITFGF
jgi:hypothetical protein